MARHTEPDTIRILVSTDNHVGYGERDPIRKDDSWKTFDEIMNLARKEDVDMVVLGGDLFHENKPSRKAMFQVMRSLRQNCLGMKPCELEFLSDATEILEGVTGCVNYEDPDINISIPVFSIHGNHDDPSGDGHYCSLDLLQVAGLVNYFGRVPEADNIKVKPALLQKGATKLALFGIGNVRDERMFRTFRDHKVTFYRPNQQPDDFYNLLVVHQNHHAHTATSYLPENFLPDWVDLVVWGHEHECLIDPQKNAETGFYVMQPGSSVATSLVSGEAVPKHVAILNINGKEMSVEKIPLKTVRPFKIREIVLASDKKFRDLAKKRDNRAELTKRLVKVVEDMINEANAEYRALHEDDDVAEYPPLPLVRLKVEYTAPEGGEFDCENPQRFSNRFSGKVANINDVVYFYRKKVSSSKRIKHELTLPGSRENADGADFSTIKVGALVEEYLAAQSLKILPQTEFGEAVNDFVIKNDKDAMDIFVSNSLATQLKDLLALGAEEDDLDQAIERLHDERERQVKAGLVKKNVKAQYKPKPDGWDSDIQGHWKDNPNAISYVELAVGTLPAPVAPQARARRNNAVRANVANGGDDFFMEDADDPPSVEKKAPSKRVAPVRASRASAPRRTAATAATVAAAKKKTTTVVARKTTASGRRKGPFEDSDDPEEEEPDVIDDGDDDDFDEEPQPPPPSSSTRRARATSAIYQGHARQTTLRQTTLQLSQSARPSRATKSPPPEQSADEISDDDDFEPVTKSRRR